MRPDEYLVIIGYSSECITQNSNKEKTMDPIDRFFKKLQEEDSRIEDSETFSNKKENDKDSQMAEKTSR